MKEAILILSNNSSGELRRISGKNDEELYKIAHPIVSEFFDKHDKGRVEMYEGDFQVRVWEKNIPKTK